MITTSDFKRGMYIVFRDEPYQLSQVDFVNPGKGSAFYRCKLKHLQSGKVIEFTFKSGESVQEYDLFTTEMQYLYSDGESYYFMNPQTYEQTAVRADLIGDFAPFLKENEVYQVLTHGDEAVGMKPPKRVVVKVLYTEEVARGNTVGNLLKPATVEGNVNVLVPAFVRIGDNIAVNPETMEYLERVNG